MPNIGGRERKFIIIYVIGVFIENTTVGQKFLPSQYQLLQLIYYLGTMHPENEEKSTREGTNEDRHMTL